MYCSISRMSKVVKRRINIYFINYIPQIYILCFFTKNNINAEIRLLGRRTSYICKLNSLGTSEGKKI